MLLFVASNKKRESRAQIKAKCGALPYTELYNDEKKRPKTTAPAATTKQQDIQGREGGRREGGE